MSETANSPVPRRRRVLRKVLLALHVPIILLAAVLVYRAGTMESRQIAVPLVERIEIDEAAAAELLGAAVRYETVSHGNPEEQIREPFARFREFLRATFPRLYEAMTYETVSEHSLLFEWEGTDASLDPALLMGHYDVVPIEPGTEAEWEHPPFSGEIADDFVWGRGTLDDKGTVIAILSACDRLIEDGYKPKRTLYLAFGHDEEIGGSDGAAKISELLQSRGVRLDYVLDEGGTIADGIVGGVDKPVALVGIAEKGYLSVELVATGDGGHSSMPPRDTAVALLASAIAKLSENQFPARISGPAGDMLSFLGPEMGFTSRLAIANLWALDWLVIRKFAAQPSTDAMLRTTIAPTILRAGVKDNVIPSEARATVNFRILPGDTTESVIAHVRELIASDRIEILATDEGRDPSKVSSTSAEQFISLQKTISAMFPDAIVSPYLVLGGTDSRHYEPLSDNIYRFLPLVFKSEDLERLHGTNERIAVKDFANCIRFFFQLIKTTCG
ncbi:MAG: M20 family peptidase [Planctomycetes bacterium]|nr:M20 family peptidase [Planctomycetota bacterium]